MAKGMEEEAPLWKEVAPEEVVVAAAVSPYGVEPAEAEVAVVEAAEVMVPPCEEEVVEVAEESAMPWQERAAVVRP